MNQELKKAARSELSKPEQELGEALNRVKVRFEIVIDFKK